MATVLRISASTSRKNGRLSWLRPRIDHLQIEAFEMAEIAHYNWNSSGYRDTCDLGVVDADGAPILLAPGKPGSCRIGGFAIEAQDSVAEQQIEHPFDIVGKPDIMNRGLIQFPLSKPLRFPCST